MYILTNECVYMYIYTLFYAQRTFDQQADSIPDESNL